MTRRIWVLCWELRLLELGGSHAPEVRRDNGNVRPLSFAIDPRTQAEVPWIAPKSIIGSLAQHIRTHLADRQGEETVRWLLGHISADGAATPSRVRFLGSAVTLPDGSSVTARYRAAQDRFRGAAREGHLVRMPWLPMGTTVTLWAMADSTMVGDGEDWSKLQRLVREVSLEAGPRRAAWHPVLGSGASIGHGRTQLVSLSAAELDLSSTDDLATYLDGLGPEQVGTILRDRGTTTSASAPTVTEPLFTATLSLDAPLRIGTGQPRPSARRDGQATEIWPVVTGPDGGAVVPGSSWKGLLRSRAEFILRSLDVDACEAGTTGCAGCATCELFGGTGQRPGQTGSGLASAVVVAATPVRSAPGEAGTPVAPNLQQPRTHVAIDRFTGGAGEGSLYAFDAVTSGTIELAVTPSGLRPPPAWATDVLELVVTDLCDGLIGLGGQSSRGYGTLRRHGAASDRTSLAHTIERLRSTYPKREEAR